MIDPGFNAANIARAIPEMYLAGAVCVILLIDVFFGEKRRGLTPTLTLLALAIGAALTLLYANVPGRELLFHGLYVSDPLAVMLKMFGFLVAAVGLLYSRDYLQRRDMDRGEYYVLILTALLGIFVIVSANSLLTVYIGVELLALSVYAIVAFDRESGIAAEAAMKYFVLGAMASGVLLYGMSMIYGLTGTLALDELAQLAAGTPSLGITFGLVFIVVAVAFKFGAAPFHMWLPDVYHGAPTAVTTFISTVPQIAYFALAFRLLSYGLSGVADAWQDMLAIVAVLSLVLGNLVAIAQTNIKRMLAYSTIGNVGFILLGFVAGNLQGHEAALYYTVAYVIMALGSFGVVLLMSRAGFEADELDHFRGLHARDPLLAAVMAMLMFSTAGIPPFIGFWAKFNILQALWLDGHIALIIVAASVSIIGLFYYLRVVKLMYFDAPDGLPARQGGQGGVRLTLALNALAVLALGITPNLLLQLVARVIG
ncbi:MAG: NADH-quinone oxidoreductase subunit NuoN [Steroidobacteraceae bacterium]